MELTYRPIEKWPTAMTAKRRRSQFSANYGSTLSLLDRELQYLGARNVVLQIALSEADIRLDGQPRVNSIPSHPGIIIAFDSKFGPLSYPCDTFTHWQDNLRAIALALECLRTVDRYGITRRGEQYQGWTALPAPHTGSMTREQAEKFLQDYDDGSGDLAAAYRRGLAELHPDRNGGDEGPFKRLQEAKRVLGL